MEGVAGLTSLRPEVGSSAYPVVWSALAGELATGRLTAERDALLLEGSASGGRLMRFSLAYRDLAGVRVGRAAEERLNGRATLVIEQSDGRLLLVQPLEATLLHELADLFATLCAREEPVDEVAVVLSLKPGTVDLARSFVTRGPAFDPADKSLGKHTVFLTEREVIFVFSGDDACESVRQIMRDPSMWGALDRWRDCMDGAPRLAELLYGWAEPRA